MNRATLKIAALLFGSGMAALVYQTAWERMLRLVFGASTAASSAVLAIFLGGLGVGGAWLGKRAEQSRRPLLFYGNLEVGVALSAALSPALVELARWIYYALGGQSALGAVGATVLRLVLAAIVLGPAVVLMGGTLPAAARAAENEEDLARGRLAVLYATNTAGAVVGALLGTFVLFELFGTRLALWIAALVNLLVAMLARQLGRTGAEIPVRAEPAVQAQKSEAPLTSPRVIYGVAAAVGFAFLGLEIVWYRVLGPILGGSSFTFGLILAVALAGIGLGSFVYARRREARPATLSLLGLTVALEALCVGYPLALGDDLALLAAYLRPTAAVGFGALVASWVVIAAVVVLPAAFVAGYQFPVLFALLGRGRREVARQVGLAYAFNTAGSIVGALLVGFVLLPRIGAIGTWRLVIGVLVVLAAALVAVDVARERRLGRAWPAAVLAVLAALLLRAEGPTAVSRHSPIGAGRVQIGSMDRNALRDWMSRVDSWMYWEADGVESSVGVLRDDGIAFMVNGKSDGAVIGDRGTQALLGLLPAILHPEPKTAFVLGLGTGMTAGWLSAVPSMTLVDVAELEPAIVRVARDSAAVNQDVLSRPNVKLFLGDGREFLQTHPSRYDIIVSEPSNPYRAGVASLFTRDFYELVKTRLAPGGYFAQWVQAYDIDAATFRVVIATLVSVFPHVEAWQPQSGDFVLIATTEPRTYDADLLRRRVGEEPYRTMLPRAGLIQEAEGVIARFNAGADVLAKVARAFDPPINTDDTTVLEYAFARNVGSGSVGLSTDLARLTAVRGLARPPIRGEVDWRRVEELRPRGWFVTGDRPEGLPWSDSAAFARAAAVEAGCRGDVATALARWSSQRQLEPRDVIESYVVGGALAQAKDERALGISSSLGAKGYVAESHVIRARLLAGQGKREAAVEELFAGLGELRKTALPLCDTAHQTITLLPLLTAGRQDLKKRAARELLAGPLAAMAQDSLRRRTAQALAFESGDPALCVQALGDQLTRPFWQRSFLASRADCLVAAGHPLGERAREDLASWISMSAGDVGAGLELPPPLKDMTTAAIPGPDAEAPDAGPVGP